MTSILHKRASGIFCIVTGPGGRISESEWSTLLDALAAEHPLKVAVITESAMVRGAITALGWLGKVDVKGFSRVRLADALAHPDSPASLGPVVLGVEQELREALDRAA